MSTQTAHCVNGYGMVVEKSSIMGWKITDESGQVYYMNKNTVTIKITPDGWWQLGNELRGVPALIDEFERVADAVAAAGYRYARDEFGRVFSA